MEGGRDAATKLETSSEVPEVGRDQTGLRVGMALPTP